MKKHTWYYNHFDISLPNECIKDCTARGSNDEPVKYWTKKLDLQIDPYHLLRELSEYGCWDAQELANHETNLKRIVWITAHNIKEDLHDLKTNKRRN